VIVLLFLAGELLQPAIMNEIKIDMYKYDRIWFNKFRDK